MALEILKANIELFSGFVEHRISLDQAEEVKSLLCTLALLTGSSFISSSSKTKCPRRSSSWTRSSQRLLLSTVYIALQVKFSIWQQFSSLDLGRTSTGPSIICQSPICAPAFGHLSSIVKEDRDD
jgi:hypothetical protein